MSDSTDTFDMSKTGFVSTLGIELTSATADRVTATLAIGPHLLQPYGIVHGGVYCSVIETLASVGAALWFGDRGHVVGVSNQTDFLRAIGEGSVTGLATPIHRGRTSQLWLVEVTSDAGKMIARGQVRLANITEFQAIDPTAR